MPVSNNVSNHSTQGKPKTVLFLCTGNYYRSRFAELLFNHLARETQLNWRADSSGLAIEVCIHNVGPISRDTLAQLKTIGVACDASRDPKQCVTAELQSADLIVALKEMEHRPLLDKRFAGWADRVEYWHVHDLDFAGADEALPQIRQHVIELVERLKRNG